MILDSNIVIYSAQPEYPGLRRLIATLSAGVSAITVVEVLGYHKLTAANRLYYETLFSLGDILPVTDAVIDQAVALR